MSLVSNLLAAISRPQLRRASADDLAIPGLRRYPGPRSFEDNPEDAALFCGREEEVAALAARVRATRLLVLFGRSGCGKTSLLQAGAAPALRQHLVLPIRVRIGDGAEPLVAIVAREMAQACATHGYIHRPGEGGRLGEWLARSVIRSRERLITPALVFDQFEEVFTLLDATRRNELAAEIGEVASGFGAEPGFDTPGDVGGDQGAAPRVKVVLSLREDFVGALEELAALIPGLFHERFQLAPLKRQQARRAIEEPAGREQPPNEPDPARRYACEPFVYDEAVIGAMLDYLTGAAGYVEPFQLQIVCRYVENAHALPAARRGMPLKRIGTEQIRGSATLNAVMSSYYDEQIALLPLTQRRRAREMCEEGLLTAKGFRLSLQESQIAQEYRLDPAVLALLVKGRLLRREYRLENYFYELSHDSLAGPILAGRPRWRVPRRMRPVVDTVLVAILIGIAALAYYGQQARHERDSADNMVGLLIGDNFVEQVLRTGRLDILERVQREASRYYRSRASRATPDALRNLALLARNDAFLAVLKGDTQAARGRLETARAGLQSLIDNGDDRAANAIELGITLGRMGELAREQGRLPEAVDYYQTAVRVLEDASREPPTGEHGRLIEWRGRLAEAWSNLAEARTDQGDPAKALEWVERSIPPLQEAVAAQAWQSRWPRLLINAWLTRAGALDQLGRRDEARQLFNDTDVYVRELLRKDPLNAEAVFQSAVVLNWIVVRGIGVPEEPLAADQYRRDLLRRSEAALTDINKLIKAYPARPARKRDVAVLNSAAADLALKIDPHADVLSRYALAEHSLVELTEAGAGKQADPEHAYWRIDLAIVRHQYALALNARGQNEQAARLMAQSRSLFEELAREDPSNATVRDWLRQF